ncbi:MAG: metal ABC transporter permease [Candidatus Goldbacteria bacterium]|nr:metal ABC transporter permease [Candidatus Goldiibacteriota bacterium]
MLELIIWPFIACVVLAGIHAYLGMHVIERGVIFVDLALAQTAALGALLGFLLGIELHTTGSYFVSLTATLVAAIFLSWSRSSGKQVQQEAIVGILYVFAAAVSVLILSKAPSEAEHIKYMLVGNILFVKPQEVIKMAVLYSAIGIFHYIFRKNFFAVTEGNTDGGKKINVPFWDFVFYATFGAVVTSSVEMAGVLLVFSFLIVPAVCAMMFFENIRARLFFSWILGITGSLFGMAVSVFYDLPTGASVVAVFGILFTVSMVVRLTVKKRKG